MRKPTLGETNLGALAGAVVGGVGGLFAAGIAPALIEKKLFLLFGMPRLGLVCWLVSLPLGWLLGGQLGPRVGSFLRSPRAELLGGVLGGLVPVTLIALWGWYMVTPH
jgi:hypothetical protein